ncbi:MAG TPA: beta-propeller fold lactonase family protein [Acidobacteriaceae bacterium]|nr:beta-propeller fold lactonase family protein [Acidobacteriaceae bacterium]
MVFLVVLVLLWQPGVAAAPQRRDSDSGNTLPRSKYLSPVAMQLSPDGHWLYIACEDSDQVLQVDTRTQQVTRRIRVGRTPRGITISPDGKTLYVSNENGDDVTEIDAATFQIRRTLAVGWGPVGLTTDRSGKILYVANTLGDDISVVDLQTGRERKRLEAGHYPEYIALSHDGSRVYVANLLARVTPADEPPVSELTVIDTRSQVVAARINVPGVIQMRHITELPASAGGYLLILFMRPKNLNPLVQIQQGWYLTHGLAVIRPAANASDGPKQYHVAEVLLDDIDHYYADGFGVAATPNGRWALVTASGANVVSVIDTAKLRRLLLSPPPARQQELANRLDSASHFVTDRLPVGRNPTDVVTSLDGRFAYIANRMDDTVSVVDMEKMRVASTIDLGGPKEISRERSGERLFFDASHCYQGQMACATCHPHEGLSDGLAWSLETPQLGRDVVENRTLYSIDGTSPFKWNGKNPNLQTQDGPRTAMYIFRSQGFSSTEVNDLVTYLLALRLPRNPHLASNGQLTDAQARGRAIFFRDKTMDGKLIPPLDRCYTCHSPQTHYTSRILMDVGTATPDDTIHAFDVPQLEGVVTRPPYLHNGEALELEDIWTKFNPSDKHGITSDLNKAQLNDLIEFLKTL